MARVKHMGIVCRDPDLLKDYYCQWFGFEELKRLPDGTVYLSDGYLNVGLLKENSALTEANSVLGLHHVGFHVESVEEMTARLKQFDASMEFEKRPEGDPYSQYRLRDPEGLHIDLSERGYGVEGEKKIPGIRHIATGTSNLERKLRLYEKVFGMREVEMNRGTNEAGARTRGCMADGSGAQRSFFVGQEGLGGGCREMGPDRIDTSWFAGCRSRKSCPCPARTSKIQS